MIHLVRDIRFALRKFARAPVLTAAAVVTLALGIGANTAIFSMVDGMWMRPLPIADPAHLLTIQSVKAHASAESERSDVMSSYPEFQDIRAQAPAFSDVAASSGRGLLLDTADGMQLLMAQVVSDNWFAFVGVQPEFGRLPREDEIAHSPTPFIMVSHGTWKRLLGGDPSVVGRAVKVNGGQAILIAVMPAGFRGMQRIIDPQVYIPQSSWYTLHPEERQRPRANREYDVYARLRSGATLDQAGAQLQALSATLARTWPQANNGRAFTVSQQTDGDAGRLKIIGLLLLAVAGAVLLIACTNVANLLMALNDSRRREIAMRIAIGAARGQIVRQLVTEYALLALAGLAFALLLAQQLIRLVPALIPDIGIPLGFDFRIDYRVIAFASAASVLALLAFGLAPAIASMRLSPLTALHAQDAPGGRLRAPTRKIIVVAQLAVSMGLVVATGLLVKALVRVQTMDMGFNSAQNAVVIGFSVAEDDPHYHARIDAVAARMRALPGVTSATISRVLPFPDNGGGATRIVLAPGEAPSPTAGTPVWFNLIDESYFTTMQIPLLRGRTFSTLDGPKSQRTAIINQALANHLFGADDAVGRHIRLGRANPQEVIIIGVTKNGKYGDLAEAPQPYLYLPSSQYAWSDMTLIAATSGDPRPILRAARTALRQLDPGIVVLNAQTLTDHMRLVSYMNRVAAWLTSTLGALALLLTAIGLYGVTSYAVSHRTREIGIRIALGAVRSSVFTSVLRDGLTLTLIGISLGAGLAFLLGRSMTSLLFGVKAMDATVLTAAIAVLLAVSLLALIPPANRAVRVDPATALRDE